MKIRSGFVSNSSSSSFIVFFKSIPNTKKELAEMMWGSSDLEKLDPMNLSAVESVFDRIKNQKPCDYAVALDELLDNAYYDDYRNEFNITDDNGNNTREKFTSEEVDYMALHLDEILDPTMSIAADLGLMPKSNEKIIEGIQELQRRAGKNAVFYFFNYEDHGEFECYMHNGDGFGNLDYMSFSHH